MSPFDDMSETIRQSDLIWKALADSTRRELLDVLGEKPQTTGDLVDYFSKTLCRTAVMKHLDILVEANLVVVSREGRQRWNYLNPLPIQYVCDRWVSKHVKRIASASGRLKDFVEKAADSKSAKTDKTKRNITVKSKGKK